jgi:hypothetical protein
MDQKVEICIVCAWRENCQKKFSVSGKNIKCPDFARDLSIKDDKAAEDKPETQKK